MTWFSPSLLSTGKVCVSLEYVASVPFDLSFWCFFFVFFTSKNYVVLYVFAHLTSLVKADVYYRIIES